LIIATVLFVVGLFLLRALGFGDDPSLTPGALAGSELLRWSL
jgi:hypothetical protein